MLYFISQPIFAVI